MDTDSSHCTCGAAAGGGARDGRRPRRARTGGCDCGCGGDDGFASATAVLVVLAIILVVAVVWMNCRRGQQSRGRQGGDAFHGSAPPDGEDARGPESHDAHTALGRLSSTAAADPLITGQLYAHADYMRDVYAQRTSHGSAYGLTEYSSSGAPGDVGVDVGPYGLEEYGGRQYGYDDGLPAAWDLPATPIRWYRPKQRDYYGPEGPTVYSEGLYTLQEGDHDPLVS